MVDGPGANGPLPLRSDDKFKKRYNVAVSRARDQLWVVYSLNPDTDLKGDDLRLRLIRYAQDPEQAVKALRQAEGRVQSEFERLVLRDLAGRGYTVTAQFPVGRYSIDLVVECEGKRMAVECDGDRFHGLEQLEADMQRQALLERLGWRFIRIRGSSYFREPDAAMAEVVERLDLAEIHPVASGAIPEATGREVATRVVASAEEIRHTWLDPEEADDDDAESEGSGAVQESPIGTTANAAVPGTIRPEWISDYDSVLVLLRTRGTIANRDVQDLLGVDRVAAAVHLKRMVWAGIAVMEGAKRGARYRMINVVEQGEDLARARSRMTGVPAGESGNVELE
jgi:very-short-patch-repair endonuclease